MSLSLAKDIKIRFNVKSYYSIGYPPWETAKCDENFDVLTDAINKYDSIHSSFYDCSCCRQDNDYRESYDNHFIESDDEEDEEDINNYIEKKSDGTINKHTSKEFNDLLIQLEKSHVCSFEQGDETICHLAIRVAILSNSEY